MKSFFKSYGFILFWLLALTDIIAVSLQYFDLAFIAKPLLIPVLMCTLISQSNAGNNRWLLLAGLFFSFAGDVFLLYETSHPLFFIFGLASFLITHIFYIAFFLVIKSKAPSLLRQKPFLIFAVAVYSGGLLFLLIPNLGSLTIPVILYALVLSSMLLSSLHIYNKINAGAARLFITGAAFFVLSDSLLALNKFYTPLPLPGLLIMVTYCLAQFYIVKGFIAFQKQ
ncbi:MAG: lysoplasmalogenase [Bacteroidetes bacterium]|nr:lysoplasmalogenase [Bacteroidota bacterium]MBS1757543.1 lysoplasmalogenase [Bacteroidota bacterium]